MTDDSNNNKPTTPIPTITLVASNNNMHRRNVYDNNNKALCSELLALLNNPSPFTNQDLITVATILEKNPQTALAVGSHRRSTIWMCAQHSD